MVRVYNPNAQEAKAGGMAQILKASLDCITRLLLKNGRYGKDLKGRGGGRGGEGKGTGGEERGKEGKGKGKEGEGKRGEGEGRKEGN